MAVNGLSFDNLRRRRAWQQDLAALKASLPFQSPAPAIGDYSDRGLQVLGSRRGTHCRNDAHRYTVQRDVQVATPDGARICALIVRPAGKRKLPRCCSSIYNDAGALFRDARRAASNDYVGVMG